MNGNTVETSRKMSSEKLYLLSRFDCERYILEHKLQVWTVACAVVVKGDPALSGPLRRWPCVWRDPLGLYKTRNTYENIFCLEGKDQGCFTVRCK